MARPFASALRDKLYFTDSGPRLFTLDLHMDFMIVYIILRKISEWSLSTFYSGVYVQGEENVPQDGPLIM